MRRTPHWRMLLPLVVVSTMVVAGCTHAGTATQQRGTTPVAPVAQPTTSDSALLPKPPPATPWTPTELAALADPTWGRHIVATTRTPGPVGQEAILIMLSDAGLRVVDSTRNDATFLMPRQASHAMWLQAGQVVGLTQPSLLAARLPLNGMLALLSAATNGDPTRRLPPAALRAYFRTALATARSPDELAWRDILIAEDNARHDLRAALSNGQEYSLNLLQADLLLARLRGDGILVLAYAQQHGGQLPPIRALSTSGLSPGGPGSQPAPRPAGAPVRSAAATTVPCSLDPIPDWAVTATADYVSAAVSKLVDALEKVKGAQAGLFRSLSTWASGASAAMTALSFLLTRLLFQASLTFSTEPVQRTKSTVQDGEATDATATFVIPDSGITKVSAYLNCLRVVAALKMIDFKLPESGPWKDARVSADIAEPMKWKANNTQSIVTRTGRSDSQAGRVTVTAIAKRQPHQLPQDAQPRSRKVLVKFSVNPDTMSSWWSLIGQATADAIELALGAAAGGVNPAIVDVTIKAGIHAANALGYWGVSRFLNLTDWTAGFVLQETLTWTPAPGQGEGQIRLTGVVPFTEIGSDLYKGDGPLQHQLTSYNNSGTISSVNDELMDPTPGAVLIPPPPDGQGGNVIQGCTGSYSQTLRSTRDGTLVVPSVQLKWLPDGTLTVASMIYQLKDARETIFDHDTAQGPCVFKPNHARVLDQDDTTSILDEWVAAHGDDVVSGTESWEEPQTAQVRLTHWTQGRGDVISTTHFSWKQVPGNNAFQNGTLTEDLNVLQGPANP